MTAYRDQVLGAVAALRLESDRSYAWFGRAFPCRSGEPVRQAIARRLYTHFYCPGAPTPHAGPLEPVASIGTARFVHALSEANAGTGGWEAGWRIVGNEGGSVVVERQGLRAWASRAELDARGGDRAVALRRAKDGVGATPGYYLALGDAHEAPPEAESRFYLNVTSDGAVDLVGAVTTRLNDQAIPFRLKVLDDPRAFVRCDAAVLYVADERRSEVEPLVLGIAAQIGTDLLSQVPALTQRLAHGVGFAEGPGDGQSFGTSRCGLLAAAVERAHATGATSPDDRLALVEAEFAAAAADLDQPFLRAPARSAAGVVP